MPFLENGFLPPTPRPPRSSDSSSEEGDEGATRQIRSAEPTTGQADKPTFKMRHGWEVQLESKEQAARLSQNFFMYYEDKRHETAASLPPDLDPKRIVPEWRMKDRLKTVSALLALCLNVGVDPPDVIKTNPCARLECWVDPVPPDGTTQGSSNANSLIGKNLTKQYERLSLRTRYKVVMDPTIEELKRLTTNLRKGAQSERVLFHYNGHGVPKPTAGGEVWCFNRTYTQYIPISLVDLQEWAGPTSMWLWDCSSSGGVISGFLETARRTYSSHPESMSRDQQSSMGGWENSIHFAACRRDEVLPTNPRLPADVFTSCLTSPIDMAVRFFILQNPLAKSADLGPDDNIKIPGTTSERRTPLGELMWIFTAITDTIAWNCLSKAQFKKLFRQDLMVAALFRNFLLAQRIMRVYHCHPQSYPPIVDTHEHPLWQSWDLALEMVLAQLPKLNAQQKATEAMAESQLPGQAVEPPSPPSIEFNYQSSDFFADQLSAFEVYLTSAPANLDPKGHTRPPEQLPIVLQVLLSQSHRLRALILLSKFLDMGPWAVGLSLSIGIFPYVLKLLQSQAVELKPPMIFIWARILAVDQTCQADLLKDSGYTYFTSVLNINTKLLITDVEDHRAMCAFVIAMLCKDFRPGQEAVLTSSPEIIPSCLEHIQNSTSPLLRQFSCLCLARLWQDYPEAKEIGWANNAPARICDLSHDAIPEVRAAALNALESFVGTGAIDPNLVGDEETIASVVVAMGMDGSVIVRREFTVFYSSFVKKYLSRFIVAAWEQMEEERERRARKFNPAEHGPRNGNVASGSTAHLRQIVNGRQSRRVSFTVDTPFDSPASSSSISTPSIYRAMWRQMLSLSADPHPDVARNAAAVVDYVTDSLVESPLGPFAERRLDELVLYGLKRDGGGISALDHAARRRSKDTSSQGSQSPTESVASRGEGYFGLSRTVSVAAAMKSLFGSITKAEPERPPSPVPSDDRLSTGSVMAYRSRPLTAADASKLPPDALDRISGPPHQPKAKTVLSPFHVPRDPDSPLAELPKSSFLDWSAGFFREPQLRPSDGNEPGSRNYNERTWRRNRNDGLINSTQPLKKEAGSRRWDVPCGCFGIGAAPMKMLFHQFEDHLVTSDDRDSIAVWDWHRAVQLCRFSNGNPSGSRVTSLRFINEDDQAMLMTGSSDGVIKIFRNYDDINKIQLVTGFRALSRLIVSDKQNAGLVFDWQQGQGRILVAGDDRIVRVWNAATELCTGDIPARSGSCITSLTSDQVEGNVFVAGFGNGSVRAYDLRINSRDSMIMNWADHEKNHRSWVVGVHLQRGGIRELISAESNGGVRLWDLRMRGAVARMEGKRQPRNLRTLSVHEHAPVFATGHSDHAIRVYNVNFRHLSTTEPYMSYLRLVDGPRNAPVTATAFHPHRMMLACGAVNDGHVNLFRCDGATGSKGGGVLDDELNY
ncbi:hypothetical protein K470DRAFT_256819 [Piedraia hortae CBS 480.64]|uniref:Raptor N-terminal CASPase-like domain-containing protein n=1 Tax=Piedraia hortae CBS 480.64 TaxID=1314780 RepID=A0A6A7C1I3_9PEZI|nr:hypothetical protein K470DRAFT_256819 [Piedraia hortae CBS 480.64]